MIGLTGGSILTKHTFTKTEKKREDCGSQIKERQGQEFGAQLLRQQQKYHAFAAKREAVGFPCQRLRLTFLNHYKGPGREMQGLEEVRVSGYSSR